MTSQNSKNLPVNIENDVRKFLDDRAESLSAYAVSDYNHERFRKSAMVAFVSDKNLSDCLKSDDGRASVFQAMRFAATTGLSLNPQEGQAAIIAFGGKAQYQIMKNGMVELVLRSGRVDFIKADAVRENDDFNVSSGSNGDSYGFSPALKDRGEVIGFFSAVKFLDGRVDVKYITIEEVRDIRDKYSKFYQKNPNASPWKHSEKGMGLKTVIKEHLRNLAISPDVTAAVGADDRSENEAFTREVRDVTPRPEKGTSSADVRAELENKSSKPPIDDTPAGKDAERAGQSAGQSAGQADAAF